jgi:hypothetical protein
LQGLDNYLANLQLLGGSVQLSASYQTNGLIHQLDLSGSTLLGSNRVSGTLNLFSGGIAGQLSISANGVLNWSAGQFGPGSSLTVETNGLVNLTSSSEKILGGLLSNSGQVEWLGGIMTIRNDAASYGGAIVNFGLWEIQADLTMQQFTANNYASLQNNGTMRKAAGSGTATLDLVFVNQGTIEQLSGVLTFGRNFSLTSGTVLFGIAGNSTFGRINLSGTASLAGRLAARLLNGYVPPVSNLFQVMSYGVVAGSFSDYSGLDVGSGRAFAPIYTTNSLTLQAYATNSANAPIVLSHAAMTTNKLFTFQFTGNPGTTYTVEYSTNSTKSWNTLLVTNIPVSPATVVDPTPPKGSRLYRVFRSGTAAPIVLLHPAKTNNVFTFQFTGTTGITYTVQYSTNSAKTWNTLLVTNIPVSPATIVDPTPLTRTRFYRVFR